MNLEIMKKILKSNLPKDAEVIIYRNKEEPMIFNEDIDGDGKKEIIGAYKLGGEPYVLILKNINNKWITIDIIKNKGYDINFLSVKPLRNKKINNLVIGWQMGAIWSELEIYEYKGRALKRLLDGKVYSRIDLEDMKSHGKKDGLYEIALWVHDTGEAYSIDIYKLRYIKLYKAPEYYPYYFEKVVRYYEKLVKKDENSPIYLYYLILAYMNTGRRKESLKLIDKALALKNPYKSREELLRIRDRLEKSTKRRKDNTTLTEELPPKLYEFYEKVLGGTEYGYINEVGNVVIPPKYEYAREFSGEGLAIVEENGMFGVICREGNYTIPPKYSFINIFYRSLFEAYNGEIKIVDKNDNEISKDRYRYLAPVQDERAVFEKKSDPPFLYGYLNESGEVAIKEQYRYAYDFSNGKALVNLKNDDFQIINKKGEPLESYSNMKVSNYSEGKLAYLDRQKDKYGYIDEKGNKIIPAIYSEARGFKDNRAVVNTSEDIKNAYGVIDEKGQVIIPYKYNDIRYLGKGLFAVGVAVEANSPYMGSTYGIFDRDGKILKDFIYSDIGEFKDGVTWVNEGEKTFLINTSGEKVATFPFLDGKGTIEERGFLYKAEIDRRLYYLDKLGNYIWKYRPDIILRDNIKVNEVKYRPNIDYLVYYPKLEGGKNLEAQNAINNKFKELSNLKEVKKNERLNYNYLGDYEVIFLKKSLLVIELDTYEYHLGAAHGISTKTFVNANIDSGQIYNLKDLFKINRDYKKVINQIIIDDLNNKKQYEGLFKEDFKGIKENQGFYIKDDSLYIVFAVYEIGPYVAGTPTFKIEFSAIDDIINKEGEFWKSFN